MDPGTLVDYRDNINSHYFFRIDLFSDPGGTVWGTTTYTDDSRLSRSARHRYGLTYGYRYVVEVIILPGYSSYSGSTQHGITSLDYPEWPVSYIFHNWWYASHITFNRQGGSGGSSSATGVYNLHLHSISTPSRTGYSFNGYWSSSSGGTMYFNNNGTSART